MENTHEINQNIAKNLTYYRKSAGLTQAELAEKINYSDKSVSKWESGNGIPDVYTLMQLAEVYGITLDALVTSAEPEPVCLDVSEDAEEIQNTAKREKNRTRGLHYLIMLLSSGIVWLVATCVFVVLQLLNPKLEAWLAFLYAVPINAIVLIVYASIWKYRLLNFFSVSTLVWTVLTCLYLTCRLVSESVGTDYSGLWCVYLLGIPLQVLEILWVFFRSLFSKNKERQVEEEKTEEVQSEKPIEEEIETEAQ